MPGGHRRQPPRRGLDARGTGDPPWAWEGLVPGQSLGRRSGLAPRLPPLRHATPCLRRGGCEEGKAAEAREDGAGMARSVASGGKPCPSRTRFSFKWDSQSQPRHKIDLLCGNNFRSRGTNLIVWHKENVCGTMGKNRAKMNPIYFNLRNTYRIFN